MKKLKKVLIANRGEIALRIIRACREMGIATVAVYSNPDRNALHVRYADEVVALGGELASESYLVTNKILQAAQRVGADAIHPGYGFLSENAEFSKMCREQGIKFIGPSPEAISPMGNKIEARRLMEHAGVPVVPGSDGAVDDLEELKSMAQKVGYPVMIKAAAGGGGKGIRKVHDEEELEAAFRQASSEAKQSFGDGAVYLEKLIQPARHIEIQIFTDVHGNGIHLGERECSLQRRSQKLVEEAPSLFVTDELRQKMADVSVKGALSIGYEGAGTMEFLVDNDRNFYFIEMNTRLQVEHTVTEMVTGVDLVKEQLNVAAGNALTYQQNEINFTGHSMELRVCSEDFFNNFAPSVGTVNFLQLPSGPHVRLDSCLYQGLEVTLFYDPMLAKLVVWGKDRSEAIERMSQAVREFTIDGINTSMPLFLYLATDDDFGKGNFHTNWLEGYAEKIKEKTFRLESHSAITAALISHLKKGHPESSSKSVKKMGQSNESTWKTLGRSEALGRRL